MVLHHPSADRHNLDIARAVQETVQPDVVILFGSRAAGDHREDSDVDPLKDEGGSMNAASLIWTFLAMEKASSPPPPAQD